MGKKTSGGSGGVFRNVATFVAFPLMLLNTYALIQLHQTAGHWSLSLVPGNLSEKMTQLALIMAANFLLIAFFLIYFRIDRKRG
jgi:hypothetical protein